MTHLDYLAKRHSVPYRFASIADSQRAYLMGGEVVINQNLPPERAHWAYCHELAHHLLNHPAESPLDASVEIEQENDANRLASELLLPEDLFAPQAQLTLAELKALFPFASYEVLARRRLHFRPGLLTIFDNGKLTARLAVDGWNCPAHLFPLEQRALKECYASKSAEVFSAENMWVEATHIDEGRGVLRVILFLEGEGSE
jgi:hypothetical protein